MRLVLFMLAISVGLVLSPQPAQAYLGPGLGMGAIGSALGVIGGIFLGIFAIIWYPVKRLWRAIRGPKKPKAESDTDAA